MNEEPREKLRAGLAACGAEVLEDPARSLALIRDLGVEHRREVFALATAYQARVPHEILASPRSMALPEVLDRQTRRLCDETALAEDAARWAAESWAYALGLLPAERTLQMPKAPEPPPTPAPPPPPTPRAEPAAPTATPAADPHPLSPQASSNPKSETQNPKPPASPNPKSKIQNPESAADAERALREAHLHRMRGNTSVAEKLCRKVLEAAPEDPTALEMMGDIYAERGDLNDALEVYRLAAGEGPAPPVLEEKIGRIVVLQEEAERAEIIERLGLEASRTPANLKRRKQLIILFGSLAIFALALAAMWFSLSEMLQQPRVSRPRRR